MSPTILLRLPSVLQRTALARATLYKAVKAGTFPAPVKITSRAVAWRSSDVDAWIASRAPTRSA